MKNFLNRIKNYWIARFVNGSALAIIWQDKILDIGNPKIKDKK